MFIQELIFHEEHYIKLARRVKKKNIPRNKKDITSTVFSIGRINEMRIVTASISVNGPNTFITREHSSYT